MLFSRLVVAAVALSVAAALPAPCESEEHNASQTVALKSSSHAQLAAKPTSKAKTSPVPPKKAAPPPPKKASPAPAKASPAPPKASPPPPNNAKANNGKGSKKTPPPPPAKNNNNNKGKATSTANKAGSKTSSAAAASKTTPPPNKAVGLPPPKNTATDSGVAGVIEGCVNPDGVTECFQILNVIGSCFSIPRPLANSVGFFLPPPGGNTCTLFTDEDCQDGGVIGAGQVAQAGQNSFICNATATADTTTTTTTTTSEAAANTAVGLPPPKNTATDSGVTGVIEGCTNPDGVTDCFQILNVLGSCFSIPRPLANNVAFFLPPPGGNTCTLFSDEDCQDGAEPVVGQVANIQQNSFICNATVAAA